MTDQPPTIHSLEAIAKRVEQAAPDAARDLRQLLTSIPELRQLVVASAIRCLGATRWRYDKEAGSQIVEPDYATQQKAFAWIASYSDGLPTQVTANVSIDAKREGLSLEDAVKQSPALLEGLEKVMKRVKKQRRVSEVVESLE